MIVACDFAFHAQTSRQHPDSRMKKVQRLQKLLKETRPVIFSREVRQLMPQDRFGLFVSGLGEALRKNYTRLRISNRAGTLLSRHEQRRGSSHLHLRAQHFETFPQIFRRFLRRSLQRSQHA
jgi:hypothetical protein